MLTQENDELTIGRILLVAGAFLLLSPVLARSAQPDPILSGPAPGPCAEQAAGADYVPGADASGNPVAPAEGDAAGPDMGHGTVVLTVPRSHGRDVQVPVHLGDLASPPCGAPPPAPPHRSPR